MSNVSAANQHTPDDREQKCWDLYVQSVVDNVPNAYKAAIDSGYSEDHARNITMQGWFKERLERLKRKGMGSKAERNLEKILDIDWEKDGEVKVDILRVVADISHKTAKALIKEEWSERTELGGIDGKDLQINVITYADHITPRIQSTDVPASTTESNG